MKRQKYFLLAIAAIVLVGSLLIFIACSENANTVTSVSTSDFDFDEHVPPVVPSPVILLQPTPAPTAPPQTTPVIIILVATPTSTP